jgi:hypothetical protein
MRLYIGVDFHARSQTIAWCDPGTGEILTRTVQHQNGNRGDHEGQ